MSALPRFAEMARRVVDDFGAAVTYTWWTAGSFTTATGLRAKTSGDLALSAVRGNIDVVSTAAGQVEVATYVFATEDFGAIVPRKGHTITDDGVVREVVDVRRVAARNIYEITTRRDAAGAGGA